MKQVAILGFGLEGKALFAYLRKKKGLEITILDRDPAIKISRGAKKVLGKNYLRNIGKFDLIFRSPGVPYKLPELKKVRRRISSLTKLFFEKARKKKNIKIIGITGSVGKTTTATLLYKIFKSDSKKVFLAGNIGISPLDYLEKLDPGSAVIMELSSFQLQDLSCSPDVAIVLDIFEEHLDKHKNFKEYFDAKCNITKHQKKSDAVIYFPDNKYSSSIAEKSQGRKIQATYRNAKKAGFKLKIPGAYNYKNAMAAFKAAKLFGIKKRAIIGTINDFKGIEHRLEFVRNLKGVSYYNNSKATNIGSAIGGIDAFSGRKIVLAGGYNKKLDLVPLVTRLAKKDINRAVFFGDAASELARISKMIKFSRYLTVRGLKDAVVEAHKISEKGESVILSPGTASFDEFSNYAERGDKFKKWVRKLK
ncbi:UDP-N-acetylmuramoylalanine--D-glutamate ligase [Candidatus Giovannonibacteria bacterium RIFCSPHIGHO2_12_44_12]|uniref:UDP-N-acetylmuramoylalanine--D-glutamate ligase n=2 Tax=Candidatus Giovannoniibacteriota TaxID=1752738 RepID=A0A1F5X2W9_9BACT|nr:MAG: UDP-N-acetylmuramoylalanine--D-glutamate ligase [Candidatus Giovannonibacteria bacterium RIFCSPHIGHO2_02_43_16]OGF81911.1 MAG: UDP-N-acetylmuramoylalanine--D-glutamate ligase [Candidatus Giovannonibacteria bacterium RIFCSPHIGHO2_12_44_12]